MPGGLDSDTTEDRRIPPPIVIQIRQQEDGTEPPASDELILEVLNTCINVGMVGPLR